MAREDNAFPGRPGEYPGPSGRDAMADGGSPHAFENRHSGVWLGPSDETAPGDDEDDCFGSGGDIIRGKGIMDGAPTLAEAIRRVRDFADGLQALAAEGWELEEVIADDYGLIRKA